MISDDKREAMALLQLIIAEELGDIEGSVIDVDHDKFAFRIEDQGDRYIAIRVMGPDAESDTGWSDTPTIITIGLTTDSSEG